MPCLALPSAFFFLIAVAAAVGASSNVGVTVEQVQAGHAAARAGLQAGDVLIGWQRRANPPANPEPATGPLATAFDLRHAEVEQAPRGPLTLLGRREGRAMSFEIPGGMWKLTVRPPLAAPDLKRHLEAGRLAESGELEAAAALRRSLAEELAARSDHLDAAWAFATIGASSVGTDLLEEMIAAFEAAIAEAEAAGDRRAAALLYHQYSARLADAGRVEANRAAAETALEIRRGLARLDPDMALSFADSLNEVGISHFQRGDLETAKGYFEASRRIASRLAPESLPLADSIANLGMIASEVSDFEVAETHLREAIGLVERIAPASYGLPPMLTNLAIIEAERGELRPAEKLFLRALEIEIELRGESSSMALVLLNLASLSELRGDLVAAEDYCYQALTILKTHAPGGMLVAAIFETLARIAWLRGDFDRSNEWTAEAVEIFTRHAPEGQDLRITRLLTALGRTAFEKGDLEGTEELSRRALARLRDLEPSLAVAASLRSLAHLARLRGLLDEAEELLGRALAVEKREVPGSVSHAETLRELGETALAKGDVAMAGKHLGAALAIQRRVAPGTLGEAVTLHSLARVHHEEGEAATAIDRYLEALDALEAQKSRLGGDFESRARFSAQGSRLYRDAVGALVAADRAAEAFHVLERSRARAFLELLASRDLSFSLDLPSELRREHREANRAYDQALAALNEEPDGTASNRQEKTARLVRARLRRQVVLSQIRLASPRLGALRDPEPLDLAATRAALDPGTLLLSFALGEKASHVFAVGPDAGDFEVFPLGVGEEKLRRQIARLHSFLRPGASPGAARVVARRLSEELLAPVAAPLARARRLLIAPDGPLHGLPFAALPDPTSPDRYLVEARPLTRVASATVFAQLKRRRGPRSGFRVMAFGDPAYPESSRPGEGDPVLRSVIEAGFDFSPLPSTRREVEAIGALFPGAVRIFTGRDATEERAKAVDLGTDVLHFACHGFVDERFPLESALALSIPTTPGEGENGLLQAWEIFEQVRIDADLVTLSACGTAGGEELAGEGLIGLTQAFHYAGARTVLASQWAVGDRSTAELMTRFYRYLKSGESLDQALRRAQIDAIRGAEDSDPTAQPFHWAAFTLIGDWR